MTRPVDRKGRRSASAGDATLGRTSPRTRGIVAALLLAASVAVHWPFGVAEFAFDDVDFVQMNASIRSIPAAIGAMTSPFPPGQRERGLYRPLTNLSYAVDHAIWGDDARGYHVVNVLLYFGVVWLVYQLALVYLAGRGAALAAALLYSLHPVHCDAVDAIAGRSELLALLFGLASILLYIRAVNTDRRRTATLGLSLVCFGLACLSKETGAVLPGVVAFHAALFHPPKGADGDARRRRALRFVVPFALVLIGYLALRYSVLGRFSPDVRVLADQPPIARLFMMGAVYFEYLRLLVHPGVLQIDFFYHDTIGVPTAPTAAIVIGGGALLASIGLLAALLVRHLRTPDDGAPATPPPRRAAAIVALATFLVFLLPVSHIVDIGAVLAERFLLAPSLGFVLLIVIGADALLERTIGDARVRAWTAAVLVGVLGVAGGARTAVRAAEWRDGVRLWQSAAEAIPWDVRVHSSLATAYIGRGDRERARAALETALGLDPEHEESLGSLGTLALQAGDYATAAETFRRLLARAPDNHVAWNNLGLAQANVYEHTAAVASYSRALAIDPNYLPARNNLRESERIIEQARRLLAAERAGAEASGDPALLANISAACTVVGDHACAARFAALAERARDR